MPDEGLNGKKFSDEVELDRKLKSKDSKHIWDQTILFYEKYK